ncbi:MAG: dioxygenase [Gammaproteobacteria bacterium]|nr:dioxygenase [Gammaproteobacteria bacterium]MBJ55888.1 dioxygenase [Gammaproteobacteria bacterium]MBJ56465.1 dioxygenase [Gammaproteobacteria bacterium]HBN15282.1 dioxygenase [Pseudohongiella sp.]
MEKQIVFLSHGGGPLPLLGDQGHRELVDYLQTLPGTLNRPDAILVISAHWEADTPTVTSAPQPGLIYDYYGFPRESYEIAYPCPGSPELAQQVTQALQNAGIDAHRDGERGLDHGVFVPLKLMYPQANIPCVQLSLDKSLDAALHWRIGEALQSLEVDRLLVIGSGFSFHNMTAFRAPDDRSAREMNIAFEDWLTNICSTEELSESERRQQLIEWQQAPYARFCHPREEHLLPLHVCVAMAGRASDAHASIEVLGKSAGMFHWL